MAKIGDNPCGKKFCNNNDKKLNGRIFNDWKDPREDTIDWESFKKLIINMADVYNPDRSNYIFK